MSEQHTHTDEHAGDHSGMSKGRIWKVFGILLMITVIEFIIALWAIPGKHVGHTAGNIFYILLTLVKAYYIIAFFMHLKFEKTALKIALGVSFIFICYFIVLMLIEGSHIGLHAS